MKKFLFLMAAACVAFSCSDDDTDPGEANNEFTVTVEEGREYVKGEGNIYFPVSGGNIKFGIKAENEWTPDATGNWLTVNKLNDSFDIIAPENTSGEVQNSVLTITSGEGEDAYTVTYKIHQSAEIAAISSDETAEVPGAGGETRLTVISTHEWDFNTESDWLTATRNNNELILSANANEEDERRATVLIYTTGEEYNYAEFTIEVTQPNNGADMIIELTIPDTASEANPVTARLPISSKNFQNNTPFNGVIHCEVDWGDGSTKEPVSSINPTEGMQTDVPTHQYTRGGVYEVKITGTVECLVAATGSTIGWTTDQRALVTAVKQWGKTGLKHVWWGLAQMPNLRSVPSDTDGSFSEVTSLYHFFYQASGLEEIPAGIFDYATQNTTCRYIFSGCSKITSIPDRLFAYMPLCSNLENAFYQCTSLTAIGEGAFANLPEIRDIASLFSGCTGLTEVPADLLTGMPNLNSCRMMFYNCSNLRTVPVSLFDKNTKFTICNSLFYNCSSLVGESPYTEIGGSKIHLYERGQYTSYFESPVTHGSCFRNATFTDIDNVPSDWK